MGNNSIMKEVRACVARDEIIEATLRLLKSGEDPRMQEISSRSGYSVGAIYHHYESRDEVIRETSASYLRDFLGQVLTGATQVDTLTARDLGVWGTLLEDLRRSEYLRRFFSNVEATAILNARSSSRDSVDLGQNASSPDLLDIKIACVIRLACELSSQNYNILIKDQRSILDLLLVNFFNK
ncbi:MAG: TetR/AcrR family transcriptional regulator [Henriciella sp.]|jgi:AcrR family transcriptional regulator